MTGSLGYAWPSWTALAVDAAWKSAAVLAAAGLVCLALRRSSAAARHFVWGVALAGALAVPLLSRALPAWPLPVLPNPSAMAAVIHEPALRNESAPPTAPAPRAERPAQGDTTARVEADPGADLASTVNPVVAVASSTSDGAHGWSWAVGVWAAGAATILTALLLGHIQVGRAARGAVVLGRGEWTELVHELSRALGLRRRVRLLQSRRAVMPMTWGCLRPVVLLPGEAEGWDRERRRDVLLHELAHVRRLDCLTQSVAHLTCALYWFNPLAWLAAARMRAERERACDDLVLASGARASDYAGHLLQMARDLRFRRASGWAALAMARPSQLEGRLVAILDPRRCRVAPGRAATALTIAAVAALASTLSALRLDAQGIEPAREKTPVNTSTTRAADTMTLTGRVLDPEGKPVRNAAIDVVGRPKHVWVGASLEYSEASILGQAQTDGDGRFRLEMPRVSSARFDYVEVLAGAPGYGLGWRELKRDSAQAEVDMDVRLRPEQPLRVTVVDVTGMPARGVDVVVTGVTGEDPNTLEDGAFLAEVLPEGLRAWPRTLTTDERGQFLLSGIGRDLKVDLSIRDTRYARQTPEIKTGSQGTLQEAALALEPARIITGQVVAADTGRPIPGAIIAAAAHIQNDHANGYFTTRFRADAEGRFRINPLSGDEYWLDAFPPAGEPYLIAHAELKWLKGTVTATHDFKLQRGVVIRGKVTDGKDGRPLAGSSIQFMPIDRGGKDDRVLSGWQAIVASGGDGVYQVAVPPGRGHLLIFGPSSDFVLEATSEGMVYSGKPGGRRYYAHKVIAYDVNAGPDPVEHNAALRAATPIAIRVVGPGGQPVPRAFYLTALRITPTNPHWRGDSPTLFDDGRFELRGLAADATARVDILDDEHEWGASVEVSGRQAGTELLVRLEPCGRARARLVDPEGKPVAKFAPHFEFIATPGPDKYAARRSRQGELAADAEFMENVDRKHYWDRTLTDADGRITLPSLIPGARYRISDFSTVNDADKGVQVRKDFSVKSGETLDLGDILIEKPRA